MCDYFTINHSPEKTNIKKTPKFTMKISCECGGCAPKILLTVVIFCIALALTIFSGICITRHNDIEGACSEINHTKCDNQCQNMTSPSSDCENWCGDKCASVKNSYPFCGGNDAIWVWILGVTVGPVALGCCILFILYLFGKYMDS